jgi:hypothetical protein
MRGRTFPRPCVFGEKLDTPTNVELAVDVRQVRSDGRLGEIESLGDLGGRLAEINLLEDSALGRSQ